MMLRLGRIDRPAPLTTKLPEKIAELLNRRVHSTIERFLPIPTDTVGQVLFEQSPSAQVGFDTTGLNSVCLLN